MADYIGLAEATLIAKARNSKYNRCDEYIDAYYFYVDDGVMHFGGGDSGIVIEKNGGSILRNYEYFMDGDRKVSSTGREYNV